MALRTWLFVGGLVAMSAALGCGRSRRTDPRPGDSGASGAPDASPEPSGDGGPDAGPEPSPTAPLTSTEFCLEHARLWCDRAAVCCFDAGINGVDASPCYRERAEACYAADEPASFDPVAAAECLRDSAAAWSDCLPRADSATTRAAAASCARVTPRELPALGETCTGECRQEPELTVYCDTRSDGVGSFRCEAGGKPAGLDGNCSPTTRCLEPTRCVGGRCRPPLEDYAACSTPGECASGYCCESPDCCLHEVCLDGPYCRAEGTPLVEPEECTRLAGLRDAIRLGTASRSFVAVDGTELYWNEGLELWRSALDGSSAAVFAEVPAPQAHARYYPLGVLFDASFVYFLQLDAVGRVERATGHVDSVDLAGIAANSSSFAATETALYITQYGCRMLTRLSKDLTERTYFTTPSADASAGYVAVGPDNVYCVSNAAVYAMPLEGGAVERLVTLDAWGGPTAFHDGTLYFTNIDHQDTPDGTPSVRSFKVPDGPLEVLAPLGDISRALVLDTAQSVLYFGAGNAVGAHWLGPGVSLLFATAEPVQSLALSRTDVYYLVDSGILRLPKVVPPPSPEP